MLQFCPQVYQLFVQALGLTGDQGTALRLTAGNLEAPPVPTSVDDIGDVMNFSFVCISFVASESGYGGYVMRIIKLNLFPVPVN